MIILALATNPVTIFFIVLVIILLAPIILNKLNIPHIIGMIAAGVVVGPYGLDILDRDDSFQIFGQVGLLYLMFLAGLEIDMYRLKLNLRKGLLFGILTLFVPMGIGIVSSVWLLHLDWLTSVLLASMYAAHTLIAYPVAARFGITRSPAVLIAVVGTIIAVIGSLLTIAAVVNIHDVGELQLSSIGYLLLKLVVYCIAVLYVYPRVTRWFFRNFSDPVTQFVFVLAMVFCSAWIAGVIGLEGILGAFFAGLVMNRYVPAGSTLMSRIEFVGNALFIPYFLIGVGMMINLQVVGNGSTLLTTGYMLAVALSSKWIPAWITQKAGGMQSADRQLVFGLTTAHTAVALAVVTIGYNLRDAAGNRMMDETILNGTILVILITCAIAPIATARAAAKIKMRELNDTMPEESETQTSNILIPIANPITARQLVELALLMSPRERKTSSGGLKIFALHVRNDNSGPSKAIGRNSLDLAKKAASEADVSIKTIERFDLNITTGITNVMEERDINTVILGLHRKATVVDSFFGSKVEQLLKTTNRMVLISRSYIPINTISRIVVSVPNNAHFESGFRRWVLALGNLANELGCRIIFLAPASIHGYVAAALRSGSLSVRAEYRPVEDYDDFILIANRIREDDLFVLVSSRSTAISYSAEMAEFPAFLQKYFSGNNLMVIYPEQFEGYTAAAPTFVDPLSSDLGAAPSPLYIRLRAFYRALSGLRRRLTGKRTERRRIDL